MIACKVIPYPSVSFIWIFCMDGFYKFCNSFILSLIYRFASVKPFVVSGSGYASKSAKFSDRISVFFMLVFDYLVYMAMTDPTQPRLLSSSSSFFKNDASISALSRFAFSSLSSAFSLSISVRVSSGFLFPRLS